MTGTSASSRRLLSVAVLLAVCAGSARAQGAVSGRVSLQEKPGDAASDVANTVIYLVPKGERKLRPSAVRVAMAMNSRQFAPHVRVVTPGSAVSYPNEDPFSHNIFSTAAGFDLGTYGNGTAKAATFNKPGAYAVYCNIHAKMTAYVVVVPTPYYTTASADGRWFIGGVPSGSWELHVWHERAGDVVAPLEVTAAGVADVATSLDARGYVSKPHMNKFGKEYTSSGKDRY